MINKRINYSVNEFIIVGECAFSRLGIESLIMTATPLASFKYRFSDPRELWRLDYKEFEMIDFIIIHLNYLESASLVKQLNLMLPGLKIILFLKEEMDVRGFCFFDCMQIYCGASCLLISELISELINNNVNPRSVKCILSPKEWRALAGTLSEMKAKELARKLGVSAKTIYTQRNAAIYKLGLEGVRNMFNVKK